MNIQANCTPKISVLTIVKNRSEALNNLIRGLCESALFPDELIIVFMNESVSPVPTTPFPTHCVSFHTSESLPLAKARNYAASIAKYDLLIFLDVDCIPSSLLCSIYTDCTDRNSILSGQIRYLQKAADLSNLDEGCLHQQSDPDPIRADIKQLPYELFWSLNFACSRNVFLEIGGFDERFTGYGAEDTDFSFRARQKGIPICTVSATAYHQHHPSYSPPVNHFSDIVENARVFHEVWDRWPMEGWLREFQEMGLLKWEPQSIDILRYPSQNEIDQSLKVS